MTVTSQLPREPEPRPPRGNMTHMDAPWEHELLYRFFNAQVKANALSVTVASNRKEYVVRDAATKQEIARCPTIADVERELTNEALAIRLKTAGVGAPYCAKLARPCPDGCAALPRSCGFGPAGDCWRVKAS